MQKLINNKGYVDEPTTIRRIKVNGEWETVTLDHLDLDNVWQSMEWFKDENYLPWMREIKAKTKTE